MITYNRAGNYGSDVPITGYFEVRDMADASFALRELETFLGDAFSALKSDLEASQIFKVTSGTQYLRNEW